MEKKLNPDCPCTRSCKRHGDCAACRKFHEASRTTCQRIEREKEKAERAAGAPLGGQAYSSLQAADGGNASGSPV